MDLMKALIPSTILTLIICALVGSPGSSGGFLNLDTIKIVGHSFYWSWPFFVLALALNACIVMQASREAKM